MSNSTVVIEQAPKYDYMHDYVVLPDSFGTQEYECRTDVCGIRSTVDKALDRLDSEVHFTEKLKNNRHVIIKPNLVSVYHDSGFDERDYPETTDPRVFEAVVRYISRFTTRITIAESSGKPMPTMVSFKTAGYDRIAKFYKTGLVALELRPVVRYMLPKAEVMKEVYLPDTLDEVVRGEAFYISVPKMKTNLYTGVTLGFKNAMGTIPYFLRERNHNYLINKKLADLLYLFKPDLVVIDGIIGGEGNTPAPVDPVPVGKIIVGNQSVEADRITTFMMGFDPLKNKLMLEATARGFGDPDVHIIGDASVTPFRPAVSSFMDEKTVHDFPGLLALAGHTKNNAPDISSKFTDNSSTEVQQHLENINNSGSFRPQISPEESFALEQACTGGCLAAAKTGLEYYNYRKASRHDFKLCIVIGEGILIGDKRYWFDRNGLGYSLDDIAALPMNRVALGACTSEADSVCNYLVKGCCDPAECMSVVCHATGETMPIARPKNKALLPTFFGMLRTIQTRRRLIHKGQYVDCPHAHEDRIFDLPELNSSELDRDFIIWPLPKMTKAEKQSQLRSQWRILASTLGIHNK